MKTGYFTFVLHSHLPYVLGHGKWPHGTDWLNEAAAETYIPLLMACDRIIEKGISPRFTIGISPVLSEQLAHKSFAGEFNDYLEQKIKAAGDDATEFYRTRQNNYHDLARMWEDYYKEIMTFFNDRYNSDLIGAFRLLQDEGHIEIITCAATHGYMPLLSQDVSNQVQVKMAKASYKRLFGRNPRGIWLPECAYRPSYKWSPPVKVDGLPESYKRKGVEEFLSENGIQYFFIDSAMLKGGEAIGVYIDRFEALKTLWGVFEKQYVPRDEDEEKSPQVVYLVGSAEGKMPVGVFTRDPDSSLQVWSGEWGYPGDGNYLDFHKKRFPGGHRYWKITSAKSDLADKQIYDPSKIEDRIEENSSHFANLVKNTLKGYYDQTGNPGILVAPFDSELFGHWWFEGPGFLERVIEKIGSDNEIGLTTAGEYYDLAKPSKVISLPEGSWGKGGYHYIWLNEWTEWTWKHIYKDELKMMELAKRYDNVGELEKRIIAQAGRELMLLSASDWQFLISTWAARDYAENRVAVHHEAFQRLAEMADRADSLSDGEQEYLADLEKRDDLFPDFDPRWFSRVEFG
jgi:1,4-alpha-glucan branching enzyme